jgi:hypothetical protein
MAKNSGKIKVTTTLLLAGKTATGLEIPTEVVEQLNSGKKPAVKATINGYTCRNSIASMGGKFMLSVSAEVREKAGIAAGETVTVELELDTEVREVAVPDDLAKALVGDAVAKAVFEKLSYSKKQFFVLPIEQAKTEETRQRRIEKTIAQLKEGK